MDFNDRRPPSPLAGLREGGWRERKGDPSIRTFSADWDHQDGQDPDVPNHLGAMEHFGDNAHFTVYRAGPNLASTGPGSTLYRGTDHREALKAAVQAHAEVMRHRGAPRGD